MCFGDAAEQYTRRVRQVAMRLLRSSILSRYSGKMMRMSRGRADKKSFGVFRVVAIFVGGVV
jgi:hypothetical protein